MPARPLPGLLGFVIALGTIGVIALRTNFDVEALADKGFAIRRNYVDLSVYQRAGADVAAGGNLYGGPLVGDLAFTYPPCSGLVFQVLADVPFDALSLL